MSTFWGYVRADGLGERVGIRNHLLVMPSVVCANDTAVRVALQLSGAVYVTHQHGCAQLPPDAAQTLRTLAGFGANPNVGACIVVGLGCETVRAEDVAAEIERLSPSKPVFCLSIQESGGTIAAIERGVRAGREMLAAMSEMRREERPLSDLVLGLECGGSDAWSGLSANPAVGWASDRLVKAGGTSILSESQEMIGAEHLLAARAVSPDVGARLVAVVRRAEEGAMSFGVDIRGSNPTQGNMQGGLTTLEEKSLGCIAKGGTAPLLEVLDFAERPTKRGLVVMDTPGHDIESITGMVAGGAQAIFFTTGRGTCTGCPVAPVIKVCSNTPTFERMRDNMDVDAGSIISGSRSIPEVGDALFEELLRVANGKSTKSEDLGYGSFAINRIGPTQ
ncbi:MAG: UxaA family hydrolase [Synergistaceae bacterium]|jgi:altronate dehydratase large subunit|nr:UxaA family hydrolase [Synergistaceae bacterium]